MEVWFSSDHHFGHANVVDFCDRPWRKDYHPYAPDVEWMNEALVERWNETVAPDDIVYYVGDFALGQRENVTKYGKRLNGQKHLVAGNHDRCWTGKAKGYQNMGLYVEAGFMTIQSQLFIDGYLVSHFPYDDDYHNDKYSGFRPSRKRWKCPLICGHVHDRWRIRDDQINVGVDVNDFRPISLDQIKEELPQDVPEHVGA